MKPKTSICLLVALLFSLPLLLQAQTGAYGVAFDVPDGWTVNQETNPDWTKFRMRQNGGLPKVMIQIYSANVSPISVLNAYVTAHRTKYRDNGWQYSQSPTNEAFGKRIYNGRQIFYTANGSSYCQRFFALKIDKQTVLVMSLAQVEHSWNYWGYQNSTVPDVLGPIAASLRSTAPPAPQEE